MKVSGSKMVTAMQLSAMLPSAVASTSTSTLSLENINLEGWIRVKEEEIKKLQSDNKELMKMLDENSKGRSRKMEELRAEVKAAQEKTIVTMETSSKEYKAFLDEKFALKEKNMRLEGHISY